MSSSDPDAVARLIGTELARAVWHLPPLADMTVRLDDSAERIEQMQREARRALRRDRLLFPSGASPYRADLLEAAESVGLVAS